MILNCKILAVVPEQRINCVFTFVQYRHHQYHQVGAAPRAKHAGKHEEDHGPEGGRQCPASGTHTWNTHLSQLLRWCWCSLREQTSPHRPPETPPPASGQRSDVGCGRFPGTRLMDTTQINLYASLLSFIIKILPWLEIITRLSMQTFSRFQKWNNYGVFSNVKQVNK